MTTAHLNVPALEALYDDLAEAIDRAGPEHETLLLAKLALTMANEIGDGDRVRQLIADASQDL